MEKKTYIAPTIDNASNASEERGIVGIALAVVLAGVVYNGVVIINYGVGINAGVGVNVVSKVNVKS